MLLLGGCAVGGGGEEDEFGGLPDDKAVAAQPLTVDAGGGAATSTTAAPGQVGGPTTTGRGGTTTTTSVRSGTGAGGGDGSGVTTTTPDAKPYVARAEVADRTGDAGLQAEPYGDLILLRVEDDGSRARFTVRMAGALPAQPAEGEVIGIGVDLFRGGTESEYQVFALGNADGWRAWLKDEANEAVDFPGTFELGGNTIVFTVPWSALGSRRPGAISVFADWSQQRVAVVAEASEDHAPDRGAQSFSF